MNNEMNGLFDDLRSGKNHINHEYYDSIRDSKESLARQRYYMFLSNFRKSNVLQCNLYKPVKYMTVSQYYSLLSAYSKSDLEFNKACEQFEIYYDNALELYKSQYKSNTVKTVEMFRRKYNRHVSNEVLYKYIQKGIEHMDYIAKMLFKHKYKSDLTPLDLFNILFGDDVMNSLYNDTTLPICVRYMHLTKKLNIKQINYLLSKVRRAQQSKNDKAVLSIISDVQRLIRSIELFIDALSNEVGRAYLLIAYGLDEIRNLCIQLQILKDRLNEMKLGDYDCLIETFNLRVEKVLYNLENNKSSLLSDVALGLDSNHFDVVDYNDYNNKFSGDLNMRDWI